MSFGHVGLEKCASKTKTAGLIKAGEGQVTEDLPNMDSQEQEEKAPEPPPPPQDMSKKKPKPEHPALIAAKSIGGMGLGMLGGYSAMKGLELAGAPVPSGALRTIVPLTTGVLGLASPFLYQTTVDNMTQAYRARQQQKQQQQQKQKTAKAKGLIRASYKNEKMFANKAKETWGE